MSKEKQIEEMTKDICEIQYKGMKCAICDTGCDCRMFAEALYNAGYRKQSEGKLEKTDEFDERHGYLYKCSVCETLCFISKHCPNCGAKMKGGAEQ